MDCKIFRCDQSGPVISEVIGVGAIQYNLHGLRLCEFFEKGVQRGFTMKTAIYRIRSVIRFRKLVSDNDYESDTPVGRQLLCNSDVCAFEAGGSAGDSECALAQHLTRNIGNQ